MNSFNVSGQPSRGATLGLPRRELTSPFHSSVTFAYHSDRHPQVLMRIPRSRLRDSGHRAGAGPLDEGSQAVFAPESLRNPGRHSLRHGVE